MTAELAAIRTAFDEEGMSPEDIASERELDVTAVKSALMQSSSKYRKLCRNEEPDKSVLNYSIDEQLRVKEMLLDLALGAEDEHLRGKLCVIIRDDALGRKDITKSMGGQNFNILMINEKMKQIRSVTNGIKERVINAG